MYSLLPNIGWPASLLAALIIETSKRCTFKRIIATIREKNLPVLRHYVIPGPFVAQYVRRQQE